MDCISITNAKYLRDHLLLLHFNTGESGEADLKDIINRFPAASQLKDPAEFAKFNLDA